MSAPKMQSKGARQVPTLSVIGYSDFREYLRDYYEFRKEGERGYSYRAFSKAAGFSSPNYLKLVIDGERNVSSDAIKKIQKAIGLIGEQASYFAALVKMNQAKTDDEKDQWLRELSNLTPAAKKRELSIEAHQYLSCWIYPVIREMTSLVDFRDDPYWISRKLGGRVSTEEIVSALNFLKDEGFIEKDHDGVWQANDNMVISSDEIGSLAIRNYHRQMLGEAKSSLESLPLTEREFGALTFNLPKEALVELKHKLKKFRQDLHLWSMQVSQDQDVDSVVQLNFQMFPHTRKGAS